MSVERARRALRGEPTDRIPLFEIPNHPGFLRELTGLNPFEQPVAAVAAAIRQLDIDLMLGSVPRVITAKLETGWRHADSTRAEIWSYDPARDRDDVAGMDEAAAVRQCQGELDADWKEGGGVALPVGRTFTTCIHYAAEDLQWE